MIYDYQEAFDNSLKYFNGDELAAKVFLDKYALRDSENNLLEDTPDKMHRRLAKEIARIEKKYPNGMKEDEIFNLLDGFKKIVLQGSPMAAIGNPYRIQSAGNCFVIESPHDSYSGILFTDQQQAQLMKRRCVESKSYVFIKEKGIIHIKDAEIGDYIYSYDTSIGKSVFNKIINKFDSFVDPDDRIVIKFNNGSKLKTSKKHPILTWDNGKYIYKQSSDIVNGDICIKPETMQESLNFNKDLADIGWFIGCHIGDGNSDVRERLQKKDYGFYNYTTYRLRNLGDNENVIKKYAKICNKLTGSKAKYKLSSRKYYKTDCWEYVCQSNSVSTIQQDLFDNQIGSKTYSATVPRYIIENNLWIPFIAGLIDSDGHIRKEKTINIDICAKNVIDQISCFLSCFGYSHYVNESKKVRENESPIYRLSIHSNKELYNLLLPYISHNIKRDAILSSDYRDWSTTIPLSEYEIDQIIQKYNNIKYSTNRYSKVKSTKDQKNEKNNLSRIITIIKKNNRIGLGGLNSLLKFGLIDDSQHSQIKQRVTVKSIEKDNISSEYCDLEVDKVNNFYSGNFGMINIHNCGVGFDISTLRPKGASVANAAKTTDGIGIFMERFSNTCREVAMSGRRGALLLSISIRHPEIFTFINIKKDKKRVTGANISIRITDDFMEAVEKDEDFQLQWPVDSDNPTITKTIKAKELWNEIIQASWESAEPGILFWDNMNKYSPAHVYGKIDQAFYNRSTNPCGEVIMGLDSCRLTVVNLFSFVKNPFTKKSYFDYKEFAEVTQKAQRIMDDIVDLELELINNIIKKVKQDPEPEHVKVIELNMWKELKRTCEQGRRTGLGITGLGDTLAALGLKYGSNKSIEETEEIYKTLAINAYKSSVTMAKERGSFPIYNEKIENKHPFLTRVLDADKELKSQHKKYGRRNIALTTTAPCGSVSCLTQTTSGIEPAYLLSYTRRRKINPEMNNQKVDFVDDMGDSWEENEVYHKGLLQWMKISNNNNMEKSPYWGATSRDVDWVKSVHIQSSAQKWICHSISKTANLPKDATMETVAKVFMEAWKTGCKGFTVYREGSRSGVLLDNTEKLNPKFLVKDAIKRPKKLPCDIYNISVQKNKYTVIVGLLDDYPYEVFCVEDYIDKHKHGEIIKESKGKYKIETSDGIIELSKFLEDDTQNALLRMVSTSLRHGANIQFVVEQLQKTEGDLTCFTKSIARALKKYIEDGNGSSEKCLSCSGKLIYQEGCLVCPSCGWSKC